MIDDLARNETLRLVWVPGHSNTVGNNVGDTLDSKGRALPYIRQEHACDISYETVKGEIKVILGQHTGLLHGPKTEQGFGVGIYSLRRHTTTYQA